MVDPNRKINHLSDDDAAFLVECEQEFRSRYTDADDEFVALCAKSIQPPPIIEPWRNSNQNRWNRGGGGGGNNWNRNNYRSGGNQQQWNHNRHNDHRQPRNNYHYRQHHDRPYERHGHRDGERSGGSSHRGRPY